MLKNVPLATYFRPKTLAEFVGQEKIIGESGWLYQTIKSDKVPSLIFWGPPGSGKTTLAFIIAKETKAEFVEFSATSSGVKDLKKVVDRAKEIKRLGTKTILFIDEVHRWNKAQQDALLPHVETGVITLIGATTENPSFEVNSALLSRARVFVLEQLSEENLANILKRAIIDQRKGFGNLKINIEEAALKYLSRIASGDARIALNTLEFAVKATKTDKDGIIRIDQKIIRDSLQKSHCLYDKDGEQHYNLISALHKSLRGSDADAALYWLARMLEAGEDPLYVARRLVRFASEDVGLANSRALEQAVAGYQAVHYIGTPECNVILAQVVVYLAKCKKSNELYRAYLSVQKDVKETMDEPVPLHLRNAPTKLMKDLNYGKDYKYSPDYDYQEEQEYLPPKIKGHKYLGDN